MPSTILGKWSVGLNAFFVSGVFVSIILVKILKVLDFGDRWWDITVPIIFSASLAGLVLGLLSLAKHRESSPFVYLSIGIGVLTALFIPLHSLFIND